MSTSPPVVRWAVQNRPVLALAGCQAVAPRPARRRAAAAGGFLRWYAVTQHRQTLRDSLPWRPFRITLRFARDGKLQHEPTCLWSFCLQTGLKYYNRSEMRMTQVQSSRLTTKVTKPWPPMHLHRLRWLTFHGSLSVIYQCLPSWCISPPMLTPSAYSYLSLQKSIMFLLRIRFPFLPAKQGYPGKIITKRLCFIPFQLITNDLQSAHQCHYFSPCVHANMFLFITRFVPWRHLFLSLSLTPPPTQQRLAMWSYLAYLYFSSISTAFFFIFS